MANSPVHFPPRPRSAPLPDTPRIPHVDLTPGDQGPDVASYQGYPDWDAVHAAGYAFAFSKATEGASYVNPFHARNWDGMSVLPVRGVYHFARPDQNSPQAEAAWFIQHTTLTRNSDIPVLDLEAGFDDLSQWAITWAKIVSQSVGKKPLFYSGEWFMQPHNLDNVEVSNEFMGLWLAAYQPNVPLVPFGWPFLIFWQFSSSAAVPGIRGQCDLSTYRPAIQLP